MDFLPLKRISFSSTPPLFYSIVLNLSRYIVPQVWKTHLFRKKSWRFLLFLQTHIIPHASNFSFLLLSFSCFLKSDLIGRWDLIASLSRFHFSLQTTVKFKWEYDAIWSRPITSLVRKHENKSNRKPKTTACRMMPVCKKSKTVNFFLQWWVFQTRGLYP